MNSSFGVIFDMDGVIVHSNPDHKKAIQQFLKKHHKDISDDFLENNVYGRPNKEWLPEFFGELDPEKSKAMADEKEALFREMFAPEEHIVPGILNFLNELGSHHIPIAVATSAPVENADYILSRLDIEKFFTAVLDSSHVAKGKPDPEIYIKAAKALDKNPGDCIIFEDSVSGVRAGLKAGAKVVGVTTTHTAPELSNCHLIINDFNTLKIEDIEKL